MLRALTCESSVGKILFNTSIKFDFIKSQILDLYQTINFIEQSESLILAISFYYVQVVYSILSNDGFNFYDVLFEH